MLKNLNGKEVLLTSSTFFISIIWSLLSSGPCAFRISILFAEIIFFSIFVEKCPRTEDYDTKSFDSKDYAEKQSEKITYPLFGVLFSLITPIFSSLCIEIKIGIFLLCIHILLLSAMSYRHITYAIYMQEYNRDKDKRICPFTQVKGTCSENNESQHSKKGAGNNIQIVCNTNAENVMQEARQIKDEGKLYDASKVFISLFVK